MLSVAAFARAVDAFIEAPKVAIVGNSPPTWQWPRNQTFQRIKLPIEIDGEMAGSHLFVDAYRPAPAEKFSVGIMFMDEHVVDRLDYWLEDGHTNGLHPYNAALPIEIQGPHWHSWELNKKTFKQIGNWLKFPYASPFDAARQFDAILRWYCAERQIAIGAHQISLPDPGLLP